jgi:hypothetical protein
MEPLKAEEVDGRAYADLEGARAHRAVDLMEASLSAAKTLSRAHLRRAAAGGLRPLTEPWLQKVLSP